MRKLSMTGNNEKDQKKLNGSLSFDLRN